MRLMNHKPLLPSLLALLQPSWQEFGSLCRSGLTSAQPSALTKLTQPLNPISYLEPMSQRGKKGHFTRCQETSKPLLLLWGCWVTISEHWLLDVSSYETRAHIHSRPLSTLKQCIFITRQPWTVLATAQISSCLISLTTCWVLTFISRGRSRGSVAAWHPVAEE